MLVNTIQVCNRDDIVCDTGHVLSRAAVGPILNGIGGGLASVPFVGVVLDGLIHIFSLAKAVSEVKAAIAVHTSYGPGGAGYPSVLQGIRQLETLIGPSP